MATSRRRAAEPNGPSARPRATMARFTRAMRAGASARARSTWRSVAASNPSGRRASRASRPCGAATASLPGSAPDPLDAAASAAEASAACAAAKGVARGGSAARSPEGSSAGSAGGSSVGNAAESSAERTAGSSAGTAGATALCAPGAPAGAAPTPAAAAPGNAAAARAGRVGARPSNASRIATIEVIHGPSRTRRSGRPWRRSSFRRRVFSLYRESRGAGRSRRRPLRGGPPRCAGWPSRSAGSLDDPRRRSTGRSCDCSAGRTAAHRRPG